MTHSLKSHVVSIIRDIEYGAKRECCTECSATLEQSDYCPECGTYCPDMLSGFDYLADVLDVEWVLHQDRTLKGARLLVAFGGPNIWINTATQTVEAYWGGDSVHLSYMQDELGLEEAVSEWFNC